jgi:hypothetical protein
MGKYRYIRDRYGRRTIDVSPDLVRSPEMAKQTMSANDTQELKAAGCPDDCVPKLEAAAPKLQQMGLNWLKLVALARKFGPIVFQIIVELLDDNSPTNLNVPPATS